jgi:hypothetical protein
MEALRAQLELALNSDNTVEAVRCLRLINELGLQLDISHSPAQASSASQSLISRREEGIDLQDERTISLLPQDSILQIGRRVPQFLDTVSRSEQSFVAFSLASDWAAFDDSQNS